MSHYSEYIGKALAAEGGHLTIGRGGFSLHYANGWLSGYDCEAVKAAAITAGLPVIDSRRVEFDKVAQLVVNGPMIAVGRPADPEPWHSLKRSYAVVCQPAGSWRCGRPARCGRTCCGRSKLEIL
jgi:hypothetical protein